MASTSTSGTVVKLDIIKFAKDIMAEVDAIRSYLPSFSDEAQLADQRPTESRVNAFFRLVGLPMFVSITSNNDKGKSGGNNVAQKMMTPGYQSAGAPDGIVENSGETELTGPNGRQYDAATLLHKREETLLAREQKIGTEATNIRMASAFYVPMPLALNKEMVANKSEIFKMVSPFAVSYSLVFPGSNELSKPFLANPEEGRPPPSSTPIRRPFIETVVRIRMISLEGGSQKQQDYLKATRDRVKLLSATAAKLLPQNASLYEAFVIDQMMGALDQFADRWVMLQSERESISKELTVVLKPKTSSAQRSAFGKQGNVVLDLQLDDNSATGMQLAALKRGIAASEAMIGLLPTEDISSLTGTKVKNVMPNALTNAFVSVLRQPIERLKSKLEEINALRETKAQQADALRLELEMMTGEFSGLSLPDMVFTLLGLFLISRDDLIALLDADTLEQMKKDKVLETVVKNGNGSVANAVKAITKLENTVKDLYSTLQTAIDLRLNRSKRTSKNSTALVKENLVRYQTLEQKAENVQNAIEGNKTAEEGGGG